MTNKLKPSGNNPNGLLPCPFCGGSASISSHTSVFALGDGDHKRISFEVHCNFCPCTMRFHFQRVTTKEEAIDAWNKRVDKE